MSKRKQASKKGGAEKKSKTEAVSEITVSAWVSESSVALTGWIPGEYAIGIECKAKTAVAQLAPDSCTVGPCQDMLEALARYPDVESRFLDSLTHLARFRDKTREERRQWLHEHARPGRRERPLPLSPSYFLSAGDLDVWNARMAIVMPESSSLAEVGLARPSDAHSFAGARRRACHGLSSGCRVASPV